ncbi:MAG: hypothetical protein IKH54_06075 [Bacilli bacterium]|nr:hypothetical protein [Bacilli bacterium]
MKKVLNFIKKRKLLILLVILIILLIVFAIKIFAIFTDNEEGAIYGERLSGIKSVKVDTSKETDTIKAKIGESVKSISIRRQGRILNILITVNDDKSRDDSKNIAKDAVGELSDKIKEYYDIQLFISKDGDTEDKGQFPILGYKHHTKENITWTKDR